MITTKNTCSNAIKPRAARLVPRQRPEKIPASVPCPGSSAITAGVDGCFLACRPGSGRSLRWDGPAHRAEHRSGNVDHLGGTSAEAQRWVLSSTRVVDLPVYLSASLTCLLPFVVLTACDSLVRRVSPVRGRAVLRQLGFTPLLLGLRQHWVTAGPPPTEGCFCDAASERDSGTPSTLGSGGAAQPRSQSMEEPAEGGKTSGARARPKTASRQIASTPKRVTAERRLRAQSFTAAATPDSDTAAQDAIRQALPLQPQRSAAAGDSGGPDRQPSAAPTAAADPAPAAARDQESPITSLQRRATGSNAAKTGGGAAAKTPGSGKVPAHHDRRGHVPPADHHAEAQTGALPPPETAAAAARKPAAGQPAQGAPEAASDETRDVPAGPRAGGRKGRSAAEGSDGSDERRDGPSAAAEGAAAPQTQPQQQQQPPPKAAAGAKVAGSLFSPVFSLFGGKPASDVPPQPGPGDVAAGARSAGDEGGDRKAVDVSARPPSGGAKGDSGTGAERPADDDVHSENDTQIRVPSGQSSGSQARPESGHRTRTTCSLPTLHVQSHLETPSDPAAGYCDGNGACRMGVNLARRRLASLARPGLGSDQAGLINKAAP